MKRIAIHSVPRSGSSWLGQLVNSSPHVRYKFQPLFSHELKDFLNPDSSKVEIDDFFNKLVLTESPFLDQVVQVKKGIVPKFEKESVTHVAYKEVRYHHVLENLLERSPEIRVVGLVRNPLAVINSWLRSPREFRIDLGWKALEEWRSADGKNQHSPENFFGFDKWMYVAKLFDRLSQRYPEQFYLVKYFELLRNTQETINEIFRFCELEMTHQTEQFVVDSRSIDKRDVYAVFKMKNKDDAWKEELLPEISRAVIAELTDTELETYLT